MLSHDDEIKRSEALVRELQNQTDRGVAIVGVAWVEEALQAAIESFLVDDKASRDRIFRKSGPLSTLSARIDLARLLGMTSKVITSDLHILRELRNEFAHSVLDRDHMAISFSTSRIADRCFALKCIKHEGHTIARTAFIRACAVLNSDFYTHKLFGQKVSDGGVIHARVENDA